MYIYSYLFCLYQCKDYGHSVETQMHLVIIVIKIICCKDYKSPRSSSLCRFLKTPVSLSHSGANIFFGGGGIVPLKKNFVLSQHVKFSHPYTKDHKTPKKFRTEQYPTFLDFFLCLISTFMHFFYYCRP